MALGFTFSAGQRVTGAQLDAMRAQIDSLTAPGWTIYTPVLTAAGGGAAINNGTITGRYRRSANSDLVICQGTLTIGNTTSLGTGFTRIGLPVNASAAAIAAPTTGVCQVLDSGALRQPGISLVAAADYITLVTGPWPNTSTSINSRGGDVTNLIPFTFATSDSMFWQIEYEPA